MNTNTIVTGVFDTRADAEKAISELREKGVADESISYIYLDPADEAKVEGDVGKETGEGAGTGAAAGAAVGAIAGLAVANGVLPGLGTVFVAGPLAQALGLTGAAATATSGAATGAVAGGLVGALTGFGISEEDARRYEQRLKEGGVLVTANVSEAADVDTLKDCFRRNGSTEVGVYNE